MTMEKAPRFTTDTQDEIVQNSSVEAIRSGAALPIAEGLQDEEVLSAVRERIKSLDAESTEELLNTLYDHVVGKLTDEQRQQLQELVVNGSIKDLVARENTDTERREEAVGVLTLAGASLYETFDINSLTDSLVASVGNTLVAAAVTFVTLLMAYKQVSKSLPLSEDAQKKLDFLYQLKQVIDEKPELVQNI